MIILSNHGILQSQQVTVSPTETFLIGGMFGAWGDNTKRCLARVNSDGSLDTSFNANIGMNTVPSVTYGNTVAKDSSGNYYVVGAFTAYDGTACNRIIKFSSTGVLDTTFITNIGTGFGGVVNAIVVDSSDKIYVGGAFTTFNGATNNRIIKLNSNGTKDTSFDNTTGFNSTVYFLKLDSSGKIYAVGNFTNYKGTAANYIIKLNTDGTKDTSFDNSTGFSAGGVNIIEFDSAGKLYVGGNFTTYKGVSANRIIKLNTDGTKDTSFDNSTGFNATVLAISVDSSDKIYVGGGFTTYKGASEARIIKLNADGTKDTSFDNGSNGFNSTVQRTLIDSSGKIYVGGGFTTWKGVAEYGIIRLNTDGSKDTGFNNTDAIIIGQQVYSMYADSSNKIIIYGLFYSYKSSQNSLSLINSDGSLNNSFSGGLIKSGNLIGEVTKVAKDSSGNYYAIGNITNYSGTNSQYIQKISSSGTLDSTFTTNIGSGFSNVTDAIAITSSDKIYVGGAFSTFNSATNSYIIKLNSDGTKDTSFNNSVGPNARIYDIKIDSAGSIYVCGLFTSYGTAANYMAKVNSDGTRDTSFNSLSTFGNSVRVIAIDSAGKLYCGGNFTTYSGAANNYIIKLNTDGTKDTSFDNTTGFNGQVSCIAIDSAGKIYVGGLFSTYKGVSANRIIKLNTDGTKDTSFDNSTGFAGSLSEVKSIAFDNNGKIYVTTIGVATTYKGVAFGDVIRLNTDGSIDYGFDFIPGASNIVNSIIKVS